MVYIVNFLGANTDVNIKVQIKKDLSYITETPVLVPETGIEPVRFY